MRRDDYGMMLFIQGEIEEMRLEDTWNHQLEFAWRRWSRTNFYVIDSGIWRDQWWSWAH